MFVGGLCEGGMLLDIYQLERFFKLKLRMRVQVSEIHAIWGWNGFP